MTTFTDTWNATFETLPPDTGEAASIGASRIRALKKAIRERVAVDHSIAGDAHDGKHKQITLRVAAGDPTLDAGDGALYTKLIGAINELFLKDSAGNVKQLTAGGQLSLSASQTFPAGTRVLFQQTAAPTGWTKEATATYNDAAPRIVTGAVATGGVDAFSTHFGAGKSTAAHTLVIAEIPPHTHGQDAHGHNILSGDSGGGGIFMAPVGDSGPGTSRANIVQAATATNQNTGGGGSHSHTLNNFNIKFADCIIATKD